MRTLTRRTTLVALAAAMLLLPALFLSGFAADELDDHDVVGRYSVTSEAGGAVWAFQPGGLLVLIGPGDIMSQGSWSVAAGEREFDATIDYGVTGQVLEILGQVAPDGVAVAFYVSASDATRPDDADPWPMESRLLGERVGMTPEATPSPSPLDCTRPLWLGGLVDWDRCDDGLTGAA